MKKVTAYKCEFCDKLLNSYSGMYKHENKCFYNSQSKSCITCKHLNSRGVIEGRPITEKEEKLLSFKIKGTYGIRWDGDPESDGFPVLNDEYKYLYEIEQGNYCKYFCQQLVKLRTECEAHI